MNYTKEQISEIISKHAQKENGLHDLMELMIESIMVAERTEFLSESPGNKGNGYRLGHTYGQGRRLEFQIPRNRFGEFYPKILAVLRNKEEESDNLAGILYTKGLTQEEVSDVFARIYGEHYSKSSISRMVDNIRANVQQWLERSLETYYPLLFVDCVHIKIHRKSKVDSEAFYVALAVTEEGTREVLGIFNMPTESAEGWKDIFDTLKSRGVEKVGLIIADGIKGLDTVVGENFPGTALQRCVTHLKRNLFAKVRTEDKSLLAEDLRNVFLTGQYNYSVEMAWNNWQNMCDKWGKDYVEPGADKHRVWEMLQKIRSIISQYVDNNIKAFTGKKFKVKVTNPNPRFEKYYTDEMKFKIYIQEKDNWEKFTALLNICLASRPPFKHQTYKSYTNSIVPAE